MAWRKSGRKVVREENFVKSSWSSADDHENAAPAKKPKKP
jgi:hypothetical protein